VDEKLLSPVQEDITICYFFFKDISDDQRSATRAQSALLHRLFSSTKTAPLIKHALPAFRANDEKISGLFDVMWEVIENIAANPNSGNIVFVLDALDECEYRARIKLIKKLKRLDLRRISYHASGINLKVLVTSRPYWELETEFLSLTEDIPNIHLRGKEMSERIRAEIDIVIKARVLKLSLAICSPKAQKEILQLLSHFQNRTYLWVYLVFEILRKKP
jgi:ankyrin repeat domain-containing protein 50